jgi:hypothetical protein
VAGLKKLFRKNKLRFFGACERLSDPKEFAAFTRTLFRDEWVVYAKRPFGGPEHVLHYLARYTHRVAISNHRILNVTDTEVSFRWKDYKHRSRHRVMTLFHEKFLRRFLQHVLPRGFPRIRYFGFLANRRRSLLLPLCRSLVGALSPPSATANTAPTAVHCCPRCHAPMRIIQRLTASELLSSWPAGLPPLIARRAASSSTAYASFRQATPHVCLAHEQSGPAKHLRFSFPFQPPSTLTDFVAPHKKKTLSQLRSTAVSDSFSFQNPIARTIRRAAQPLPSYDSVRSAPGHNHRAFPQILPPGRFR